MGKRQFVIRNIIRSIIWLVAFIFLYVLAKKYIRLDFLTLFEPFFDNNVLIFSIFLISEIVIGIIPPEFFMLWALRTEVLQQYVLIIVLLSILSYLAGIVGFLIGWYLNQTLYYRYLRKRFLSKMERQMQAFGPYLIIVAALTPIPFSGVAMLVGSVHFSPRKYLLFSLTRFFRFGVYAWIIWETQLIF